MIMKIDNILLDKLTAQAKESPRLRSIMMILSVFVVRLMNFQLADLFVHGIFQLVSGTR